MESVRNIVAKYRKEHPETSKLAAARVLGLSWPTVHKWWNHEPDSELLADVKQSK